VDDVTTDPALETPPTTRPASVPAIVRLTSAVLWVALAAWTVGIVGSLMQFHQLSADVTELVERAALAVTAAFALWCVRRRRREGRWLAIGLACLVFYRVLPAMFYAGRASLGNLTAPAGLVGFSSAEEARIAFVFHALIQAAIGAVIVLLPMSKAAARYFRASAET
jgi:hypothetical protein